ncbi:MULTISPECIES: cupin domain-containing protein [unclassified Streptomyces]|uniref:cupin domain-containing protein n=1 Tax=unclassified Streptomyces TaxID=2593676 RepID=UPI00069345D9|nr:cupin domain-containing protein [Streptomyces sp. NBC_00370]
MDTDQGFRHVRQLDFDRLAQLTDTDRFSQKLIDHTSGGDHLAVGYIRTPPGGGSPRGLHTHAWEQIFYILEGTMEIEVEGERFSATPGTLVVFPAGTPHRNWNASQAPTVHLAMNSPLPVPNAPSAHTS